MYVETEIVLSSYLLQTAQQLRPIFLTSEILPYLNLLIFVRHSDSLVTR